MPVYEWMNPTTQEVVTVQRKMSEYKTPPTAEEACLSPEVHADIKWERVIATGVNIIRTEVFGKKGYW